jgi:GH15 family glucan-1,4-alpha-glucosidase
VRGLSGQVEMQMDLRIRFEFGSVVPWVSRLHDRRLRAIGGPDQLVLATPVEMHGKGFATVAHFTIREGEEIPFVLSHCASHHKPPLTPEYRNRVAEAEWRWREWAAQFKLKGEHDEAILRSLLTLKALTNHETGGIVAAPTTSLPEDLGGQRNWDYRFCWLRDATLTLYALMKGGFTDEARSWRNWLLRAIAGVPSQMQILYGVAGERWIKECEIPWLAGYENSRPVRTGNAASEQLQLDVYGEVIDLLYQARKFLLVDPAAEWKLERALINRLTEIWNLPDKGIWEIRGPDRHFTHSKVMAWVALDRGVRSVEEFGNERVSVAS